MFARLLQFNLLCFVDPVASQSTNGPSCDSGAAIIRSDDRVDMTHGHPRIAATK